MKTNHGNQGFPSIEHSSDMTWAAMLATYLAGKQDHDRIEVEDYFGAIYLANRNALSCFWKNCMNLDELVRTQCHITDPMWHYWIEFHQALNKKKFRNGMAKRCSKEVVVVLNSAADIATKSNHVTKGRPELQIEHFLAAITEQKAMKFTRYLISSGINQRKLGSFSDR